VWICPLNNNLLQTHQLRLSRITADCRLQRQRQTNAVRINSGSGMRMEDDRKYEGYESEADRSSIRWSDEQSDRLKVSWLSADDVCVACVRGFERTSIALDQHCILITSYKLTRTEMNGAVKRRPAHSLSQKRGRIVLVTGSSACKRRYLNYSRSDVEVCRSAVRHVGVEEYAKFHPHRAKKMKIFATFYKFRNTDAPQRRIPYTIVTKC